MSNLLTASDFWMGSGEGNDGALSVSISAPFWNEMLTVSPQQAELLSIAIRNACLTGDRFAWRAKFGEAVSISTSKGRVVFQRGNVRSIFSSAEALLVAGTLRGEAAKLLELTMAVSGRSRTA